jgi:hypothetical protein
VSSVVTAVRPRIRRPAEVVIGALALLVVLIGSGFAVHESLSRDDARGQVGTAPPVSPAIEARWGVRVSHVGVSADGGLVDVRFVVLDPDRALALLGDATETNIPVLIAEGSGAVVRSAALMPPKHNLIAGRTMYLLYRNTGGAIQRGHTVTFGFGKLHLEHVVAG